MTWSTDPFKHMDKDLKDREKVMRKERKLEAQENARKLRTRDLKYVAEALDLRHASPHSRRVVLTGFHEYYRVINKHFDPKPEPAPTLDQVAPGLLLSDVVAQPVTWLWQDYLPLGALTLLEGEPGSGASLLALHIAACVTSGRALPGGSPGTQGTVILVSGQDHPGYTILPRFLAAGGDPARVLLLTTVEQVDSAKVTIEDRPFALARDLYLLEEAVARTHAALVILDSLDACRPNDLRQVLPALAQLAQRSGCAILLVRPIAPHQTPTAAYKPGSLELLAAVRSSLLIQSDPEDTERQRLLIATKHALCAQPAILCFQLRANEQGILALDWLGTYTHPMPFFENSEMNLSGRNYSLLQQTILRTLQQCAAPMNARSLTSITGFPYENVRKMLQRMVRAMQPQLVSPARGLYTTPGHPCLAQPAATHTSTPEAETPVPTVASVSSEPEQATPPQTPVPTVASVPGEPLLAAAQGIPPEPLDPIVPTSPAAPDPEHDQEAGSQTAPASSVSSVPNVSTTPENPDPANDQDTNSQAAPVPSAPTVPTSGSSQPPAATPTTSTTRQTPLTAPGESAGAWESDPDQQPENP
jgi:hypothetical protein